MSELRDKNGNLCTPQELNAMLTPEERSRNARKAGIASAKARRERKQMKEDLTTLMSIPLTDKAKNPSLEKIKSALELTEDRMDVQTGILVAMAQAAMNGNVQAAMFIRDTLGEKPLDKMEVQAEVKKSPLDEMTKELFKDDDSK